MSCGVFGCNSFIRRIKGTGYSSSVEQGKKQGYYTCIIIAAADPGFPRGIYVYLANFLENCMKIKTIVLEVPLKCTQQLQCEKSAEVPPVTPSQQLIFI